MKRLTPLILIAIAGTAQPLLAQNAFNPLMLLAPAQGNPWAGGYGNISSPFGLGALNPMNPLNNINPLSPWNSYGMNNPALTLGGLGASGALGALTPNFSPNFLPGFQLAPNMMSGNPYARSSLPQMFSAPAFSPSMPSFPNLPFAAQPQQMPGGYFMLPQQMAPQQQAFPFMPYAAPQPRQPTLADFFGMQAQPTQPPAMFPNFYGAPQPVPQQQPAFPNFFGMTQPAAPPMPQPASPYMPFQLPQALPGQQQNTMPFFFLPPQTAPALPAAPRAATAPAPELKTDSAAPAPTPLDPAAFMQMYMKPQEATK